jgi:hypothetical protein
LTCYPSGAAFGSAEVDLSDATVIEDITRPTQTRLLDHASLAGADEAAGTGHGSTASILTEERSDCGPSTLTWILPSSNAGMSGRWTFQRA